MAMAAMELNSKAIREVAPTAVWEITLTIWNIMFLLSGASYPKPIYFLCFCYKHIKKLSSQYLGVF